MRRRNDATSAQAQALARAASQVRVARRHLLAAHGLVADARGRAAIEKMMTDVEAVARRADAMRARRNARNAASKDSTPAP